MGTVQTSLSPSAEKNHEKGTSTEDEIPQDPNGKGDGDDGDLELAGRAIDRRELASITWLASIGILGGTFFGGFGKMLLPAGRNDLKSPIELGPIKWLPKAGDGPTRMRKSVERNNRVSSPVRGAMFWWTHTDEGVNAFHPVCTHLGCLYDWKPQENRYICPCHGATYEKDGSFVKGPATRDLDRFVIRAFDAQGREVARTPEDGSAIHIPAGSSVLVEAGSVIQGKPKD